VTDRITCEGRIVRKRVAEGSKSERDAIVLVAPDREMLLRRMGGNPFSDPDLDQLVGKTIRAEGFEHAGALIMTDWSEV
jgi:hypothetical protein